MRRTGTVLPLTGLLAALRLAVASPASACSCAEADVSVHFADADVVFTGELVSREVRRLDPWAQSSGDPALHVFEVETVFKGEVHQQQGIVSAAGGSSSGAGALRRRPVRGVRAAGRRVWVGAGALVLLVAGWRVHRRYRAVQ